MVCTHQFFHGTNAARLLSIAIHGLLTPETLESKLGLEYVTHPEYSKPTCTYVTSSRNLQAKRWAKMALELHGIRETVSLCIDVDGLPVQHDTNFPPSTIEHDILFEVAANIEPSRIHVHVDEGFCIPIREYVTSEYQHCLHRRIA